MSGPFAVTSGERVSARRIHRVVLLQRLAAPPLAFEKTGSRE